MASSEDQAASERLAALIAKSTLGTTAVSAGPTAPARRGVLEDEQSRNVATGAAPEPQSDAKTATPVKQSTPPRAHRAPAEPKPAVSAPDVPAAFAGLSLNPVDQKPVAGSTRAATGGAGKKPPAKGGAYRSATSEIMAMPLVGPVTLGRFLTGFAVLIVVMGLVFMFSGRSGAGGSDSATSVVTTEQFQAVDLPVSASSGPTQFDAATSSGFARTPEGAALAALHLTTRSEAFTGPPVFEATIQQQVTGDPATITSMLEDRRAVYAKWAKFKAVTDNAPVTPAAAYKQVGWQVPAWTETGPVTVQLLMENPQTMTLQQVSPVVQWDDAANDFKLVVSGNRGYPPAVEVDPTTRSSYTLFATN